MVHDGHPLAEPVRLFHVVRGQHDRLAVAVQFAEQVPQGEPALRVEPRGRLVEEQHRRAVEDRPGDHQPLRHPAGQRVHRGLGPLGQLELFEQLVGDLPRLLRAHAEQPAVEVQVLPDGELPVQCVLLRNDAAQLLCQRRMGGHIDPAEERPSRGRDHARGEHPGGGRLPGTVGPEQAEDLTGLDVEVELVDRGEVRFRIDLGQVLGMDDRVPLAIRSLAVRSLAVREPGRGRRVCCAHPAHRNAGPGGQPGVPSPVTPGGPQGGRRSVSLVTR